MMDQAAIRDSSMSLTNFTPSPEQTIQDSLLRRLGLRKAKVTADISLYFMLGNIGTFDHDFRSHQDGRSHRKIELEILIGLVCGLGVGCYFDLNWIF